MNIFSNLEPSIAASKKQMYFPLALSSNVFDSSLPLTESAVTAFSASRRFMTEIICPSALCGKQGAEATTITPALRKDEMAPRRLLQIAFALLSLAVPAIAQTYNQQPGEVACRIATFECQGVPMTSGDKYTINEPYSQIAPGTQFVWDTTQGVVSGVTEQLPVYWAVGVYQVQYTIGLTGGRSATVTCTVRIGRIYRWPEAYVSNTVIVFN